MCVQYRGGDQYGGGVQYRGRGYLKYRGRCSVMWGDIMLHVGGYHEYRGGICFSVWDKHRIVKKSL